MAATSGCIAPPTLRPAPLHRHHQGSWQSSPVYSGDARSRSKTTQCHRLINPLAICTFSINCTKKYQFKKNKLIKKKSRRCRQVFSNPPQTDTHFFRASTSPSIFFPPVSFLDMTTGETHHRCHHHLCSKPLMCRINILNATHFSSATRTHTQSHAGDVRTLPTFLHLVFPGVPPLVPAGGSDITPAGGKNQ